MRIVFIGAGNLATHLSLAMQNAGMDIVQVYSHTLGHARELADLLGCDFTNSMESIVGDADLYLFSVKDSVLPGLLKQLPRNKALWFIRPEVCPWIFYPLLRHGMVFSIPCRLLARTAKSIFISFPFLLKLIHFRMNPC